MGNSTLLERAGELAAIDAALERARKGRGVAVTIEGEAGAGKSRLLAATRERSRGAGFSVVAARASELEQSVPFGVVGQLLQRGGPPEAVDGDLALTRIRELYDAVVGLTWPSAESKRSTPLMLTVDDLQWADEPSLRFLAHLALRLDDLPVCLATTVRSGEIDAPQALLEPLRGAHVLCPRPLSEAAVASLARAEFGADLDDATCKACSDASGGNPFYVHELLHALRDDLAAPSPELVRGIAPETVLRSLMVRLARLGADATVLARAVAVLGDGAALGQAATLARLAPPAAERAADALAGAGLFSPGEPLGFTHPLIGSTLRGDMGAFERAREHRRAADLLRAAGAPAERVAAHLVRVRPEADESVVAILRVAAAGVAERGDPAAAERLLLRALTEPPSAHLRPDVLLELAEKEALNGSPAARAHLEEALHGVTDPQRRASALAALAVLAHHASDYMAAVQLARRARAELDEDDRMGARLTAIEVGAAALQPVLHPEAAATLGPLLERARAGGPPTEPALLASLAAQLARADPPAEVRAVAERAIAADPLIDRDDPGSSIGWVGHALTSVDELELAEVWLDAAVDAAERRGAVLAGSIAAGVRAIVHYHRGRLGEAITDGERSLDAFRNGWAGPPASAPVLVRSHIARGDLSAAGAALATARGTDPERPEHALLLEASARLRLSRSDPAGALEDARSAGQHVECGYGVALLPRIFDWRRLAALAAHRLGRSREAGELIEPALSTLREIGPGRQLGATLTAAGVIAGGDAGIGLLQEAAAALEASPARPPQAHALLELGAALRRAGHRGAASEQLYAALDLAGRMGALPLAERARAELASLGFRPRRAARSGTSSLTPSERRIAELTARGLSNPQVANELCVTRKTVETHLHHIYRKLDVRGRRELPAALAEAERA